MINVIELDQKFLRKIDSRQIFMNKFIELDVERIKCKVFNYDESMLKDKLNPEIKAFLIQSQKQN